MTHSADASLTPPTLKASTRLWEAQLERALKRGLKASSATLIAFSLAACDLGGGGSDDDDDDDIIIPVTGDVTLTTSTDTVVADVDSNTITAPLVTVGSIDLMTLTTGDTLDGGAGTDALVVSYNSSVSGFSVVNVETITLTNVGSGASALGFGNVDLAGVTEIRLTDNVGEATLNDLNDVVPITIANNDEDVTLRYGSTVIDQTQEITLEQATGNWDLDIGEGADEIILRSEGTSANSFDSFDSVDVTIVDIRGNQDLTINGIENVNVTEINGSTAEGSLTITVSTAGVTDMVGGEGNDTFTQTNANTLTMVGNDGDDTFILGAGFDISDSISGGNGTDVLSVSQDTASAITASTATTITNVEKIQVTGALSNSDDIDFNHFSATQLELMNGTAGVAGITLKTGDSVQINGDVGDGTVSTDDLTLDMAINGSSDEATLILAGTTLHGDLIATDLEALTIQTMDGAVSIQGTTALNSSAGTETLTIIGDRDITFEQGGDITADIIDAAGLTGDLTILSGSSATSIVVGGSGDDYLGFGDDVSSNINGGAGDDQIIFDINVTDTLTGGSGADTFTMDTDSVYSTPLDGTVITDFDVSEDTLELSLTTMNEWIEEGSNGTVVTDWDGQDVVTGAAVIEQVNGGTTVLTNGDIIALTGPSFTSATAFNSLSNTGLAGNDFDVANPMDDDDGMLIAYSNTSGGIEIALVRMDGNSDASSDFDNINVLVTLDSMTMAEFLTADIDIIA